MATDLRMDKNGKQPTGKHTKIENLLQAIEREAEKPDEEADLELLEDLSYITMRNLEILSQEVQKF